MQQRSYTLTHSLTACRPPLARLTHNLMHNRRQSRNGPTPALDARTHTHTHVAPARLRKHSRTQTHTQTQTLRNSCVGGERERVLYSSYPSIHPSAASSEGSLWAIHHGHSLYMCVCVCVCRVCMLHPTPPTPTTNPDTEQSHGINCRST